MQTEVWAVILERELTEQEHSTMMAILPTERKDRLLRMKNIHGHREVLCAYTLLYIMLHKQFGWNQIPQIVFTAHGKPLFLHYPNVHFNISHTSGAVLVALSDKPIGVDIEKLRSIRQPIMNRVSGVETSGDFLRLWVSMEACGKRDGQGLVSMIRNISTIQADFYSPLDISPDYVAGVAVSPGCVIPPVHIYEI